MTSAELDFLKRWIVVLDRVAPDARAKVNGVTIPLTRMYVGVDVRGEVSVNTVEGDPVKYIASLASESD